MFVARGNAGSFGMIQAAREAHLSAFGYVYDESALAPENVLASMAWQIGEQVPRLVGVTMVASARGASLFEDDLSSRCRWR